MSTSRTLQTQTALTTVKVAGGLLLIKFAAFAFTGSSGVLGSGLDSGLDLVASLLVLWAVTASARPADADHPYGHGKVESLASLFQSVLILVSGLGLAYHTIRRAFADAPRLDQPLLGIVVMLASSAVTLWLVRRLRRVARETGSPALEADSAHYASDLLLNLSVVVGLVLHSWSDSIWPDIAVGIGISLLILNTARGVFLAATDTLMDKTLDPADQATVLRVVAGFAPQVAGFHDLRSRRSGSSTFVDIHLDLRRDLSFVAAHDLAEEVGASIEAALPRCQVTVHADPL